VFAAEVAQRFDSDIDANLVPVLEAVGDGLRRGIHPDHHTLRAVFFDTLGQGGTRKTGYPQARIVEPRTARLLGQRDLDLGRRLGRQAVKPKRSEEAEHRLGHALRDLRQRVCLRGGVAGRSVDSARLPDDQSLVDETSKLRARASHSCGVSLSAPGTDLHSCVTICNISWFSLDTIR
jgi:hypothetical protein